MTTLELLNQFDAEIKKDWTSNFKSEIVDNCLILKTEIFDNENKKSWIEAGGINSKMEVFGNDEDVVHQLEFMITR